ncbi:hypothetical protein DCAR_0417355 [Daucus carota subsp. sativus]|uniref:MULE transposase domain-containing protein n=1 Tax=Daucus carota subsp. sativus TaxID=79200 RepID=A0AAF0WYJ8_DAUCS|nr:hypothetical protein DCAR_0417355 [Daucus carota subsp. sativus]
MPFAPFVGVNHHGQSILLGCGLVSNEDTVTFVWLFRTWLTCMFGNPPNAIITDQDRAMQNAIEQSGLKYSLNKRNKLSDCETFNCGQIMIIIKQNKQTNRLGKPVVFAH